MRPRQHPAPGIIITVWDDKFDVRGRFDYTEDYDNAPFRMSDMPVLIAMLQHEYALSQNPRTG